jgi:hypothetical protein
MRIVSFKAIIFCSALFSTFNSFSMLTLPDIMHDRYNIRPLVCNKLPYKDQHSLRSTCKTLIHTDPKWFLMPENVEKETDYHLQKYGKLSKSHKIFVLSKYICLNDTNAVKWILHNAVLTTEMATRDSNNKKCCLVNAFMFAKNNNNQEIAQLLIQYHHTDIEPNTSWQEYYNNITPPPFWQECLPNPQNNNFAYLHYLTAIIFDNNNNLTQFFKQQIPTERGLTILVYTCILLDSVNCFNFLLSHKIAKTTIRENKEKFEETAKKQNADSILKILNNVKPIAKKSSFGQHECIIQ